MSAGRPARQEGFALVAALWATMMLAIIVASVTTTGQTEAVLSRNRIETARLTAIADAAINLTLLRLMSAAPEQRPPIDGTPFPVAFAGETAHVRVSDEAGKIDLNFASEDVLARLLANAGLDAGRARLVVTRIVEWRRARGRSPAEAAEEYRQAGYAYAPRAGPFETVDELRLVPGVTSELFERLAPLLTAYAQTSSVDIRVADRAVLRALSDTNDQPDDRLAGHAAPDTPPSLETEAVAGRCFRITAKVAGTRHVGVKREMVLRLSRDPNAPAWVYQRQ